MLFLSKVHAEFMRHFQPSQPGNLLFELLVFVERLSGGRLTPHYRSVDWQYNELSLHEVLFGKGSRLSNCLLALIIHPEEQVQLQACRAIFKLQQQTEGAEVALAGETKTGFNNVVFDSIGNIPAAESILMPEC